MLYKFLEIREPSEKKVGGTLRNLLSSPTVKLSNYSTLNDPNEMKFDFKIGSPKYFKESWMRRNPGKPANDFSNWFEKLKSDRPRSARTEFVLYRRNLFKIASFSLSHKSNLLWSHYAGGKRGLCIVYRQSVLESLSGRLWLAGKVIYKSSPPTVKIPEDDPVEEMKKVCFTKEKSWKYEREYRISVVDGSIDPVFIPIKKQDIFGVILGINASPDFRNAVARICKRNGYKLFEILNYAKGYRLPTVENKNTNERLMVAKF